MKISYDEFLSMVRNPEVSEAELMKFCRVEKGLQGLEINLVPNPDLVDMSDVDRGFESALQIGNWASRIRRYWRFKTAMSEHPHRPLFISEGDSWFQFPFLIEDVIDHLSKDFNILSLGAAGDTAANMVTSRPGRRRREYLKTLLDYKDKVDGFLFSAAGNDIIGEDEETGDPVLLGILRDFNGNIEDVEGHINRAEFALRLGTLKAAYERVISDIRAVPEFAKLPIFFHGYDYVFPYRWEGDMRDPSWADKDEWLGKPLSDRAIPVSLGREIIKRLLDELYTMLEALAADDPNIIVVDCRGRMSALTDWADEIHGTSTGFKKVAAVFKEEIEKVLVP